jgi:hypothetical protein
MILFSNPTATMPLPEPDMKSLFSAFLLTILGAVAVNRGLESELVKMGAEDQKFRDAMQAESIKMATAGTTTPSEKAAAMWKSQEEIDKRNLERLEEIVRQYGWPGKSLAGEDGEKAAFLIVQHGDLAHQEKYLPLLEEAGKKGEAPPSEVAMLKDRVLVREGRKQIYGTQLRSGPDTGGKLVLLPINDEEHVDERRKSVGLGPLAEYVKQFGLEYKPPVKK